MLARLFGATRTVGISVGARAREKLEELSPVGREQKFLITHGTHDPLIPFAEMREQVNELKAEGLHIEWHEFAKVHTIAEEQELALIRGFVRGCFC